ncbi:MAG: UPF0175 family protein [Syntrophothermaceae bacterium]
MQFVQITINIPKEVLSALGKDKAEFEADTRLWLATRLFQEKILSLGKAASIAGLKRLEFKDYLQSNKVDIYRYDNDELDIYRKLNAAEEQLMEGKVLDGAASLQSIREKHNV